MISLFANILILGELFQQASTNELGNFANDISDKNIKDWKTDARRIGNVAMKGIINFNRVYDAVH